MTVLHSSTIADDLRCPVTQQPLVADGPASLRTVDGDRVYPVREGVPVLIGGPFVLDGDVSHPEAPVSARAAWRSRTDLLTRLRPLLRDRPTITRNIGSEEHFARLVALLRVRSEVTGRPARVLVIGGATEGIGMRPLMEADDLDVVETDVVAGTRTTVVCDAHALPFADGAFDAVVCQGVLSVLLDPVRAVEEIHRVLAPDGLVYSETAFLQQVCNGAHDFTRWTLMGHRVLFRNFDEIGAGAHNGPGMAVAWAWTGLLMSFAGRSRIAHAVLRRVGAVTSGWLTLLDRRLVHRPGGIDDAAGTWFLGRRREAPRPDHELLATYEGAVRPVGTWG